MQEKTMKNLLFRLSLIFLLALGSLFGSVQLAFADMPDELMEQVRPVIEELLASEDPGSRAWAVRAAGLTGERDFRDSVVSALEDAAPPVRIAAALALMEMGHRERDAKAQLIVEILQGENAARMLILNQFLPRLDEDDREDILREALDGTTGNEMTGQIAGYIARRESGDIYELLFRVANISEAGGRAPFLSALRRSGREEVLQVAALLIESSDPAIQADGASLAFEFSSTEALETLEPLLESSDAALAQRIGFYLARHGNTGALSQVSALVINTELEEDLRMEALALLRDNAPDSVSLEALQELAEEAGRSQEFKVRVHQVIGAQRTDAARAYLNEQLESPFAANRVFGLAGIGWTGDMTAIPALRETMESHGEAFLRTAAISALGALGGDEAAEILLNAMRTERNETLKIAMIQALGHTNSATVPQTLAYEFAARNDDITRAILLALRDLGFSDVSPQIEQVATNYRNPPIRWLATTVLVHLDPDAGRIRLLQSLDRLPDNFYDDLEGLSSSLLDEVNIALLSHSDPAIRDAALIRVMQQPDQGLSVLREMITGSSPEIRRQAISLVVTNNSSDDVEIYRSLIQNTDRAIRMQGYSALANLADVENQDYFDDYLEHPEPVLRALAAYALARMYADD